jgi:hypothetical protein
VISTTPIERIAALLIEAKYTRLPVPLKVLRLSFDFGAAFIGSDMSSDLVVAVDNVDKSEARIIQIVEALSRALDVARSRRSLTVIVVGPRPLPGTLDRLSRVARVLPVGVSGDEEVLRDWLAILLPLNVPEIAEMSGPVLHPAGSGETVPDPITSSFEQAALQGEDRVQQLLITLIEQPFASADKPDEMEEAK